MYSSKFIELVSKKQPVEDTFSDLFLEKIENFSQDVLLKELRKNDLVFKKYVDDICELQFQFEETDFIKYVQYIGNRALSARELFIEYQSVVQELKQDFEKSYKLSLINNFLKHIHDEVLFNFYKEVFKGFPNFDWSLIFEIHSEKL